MSMLAELGKLQEARDDGLLDPHEVALVQVMLIIKHNFTGFDLRGATLEEMINEVKGTK